MRKNIFILIGLGVIIILSGCLKSYNDKYKDFCKEGHYTKKELSQLLIGFTGPTTNLTSMQELINDGANVDEAPTSAFGDAFHGVTKESTLEKAFDSNIKAVELLVNNDANVNYRLSDESTPFFKAVETYDTKLCDLFIEKGANVKIKNNEGYNALDSMLNARKQDMSSEWKNQINMIKYLENKGLKLSYRSVQALLNCNKEDKYGYIYSVENMGIMKYVVCELLDRKEKTGLDNIIEYAIQGESKKVLNLCQENHYLNGLSTEKKEILLYVSAAYCNVDVIKELKKQGINIKKDNMNAVNALLCASAYNNKEMVSYLLDKGLRMNRTDECFEKAIDYAILGKNKENIKLLLEKGSVVDDNTMTSLALTSNREILDIFIPYLEKTNKYSVEDLICEGIKYENKTILEYVSKYVMKKYKKKNDIGLTLQDVEDMSFVEYIFSLDLNIDEDNLLYYAIDNHNYNLVRYLVEAIKIDVNKYKDKYEIPLMCAIMTGNIEMIDYLVEHGADINIKDGDGDNIIKVAEKNNYSKKIIEHVKSLLEK